MIIEITKKVEVDAKFLFVDAGVRYWEDSLIDGVEDTDGSLTPCRVSNRWMPQIDIESGLILNWEIGKSAEIHFKVCDDGTYRLLDARHIEIISIEDDYVPNCMCPGDQGYGDYIIMDIDANGYIQNWHFDMEAFT